MYTRIPCRGCSRRLKLPYGADPRKARCPSCGAYIEAPDDLPPETPPKPSVPPASAQEPLSLDDAPVASPKPLSLTGNDTLLSLDDDEPPKPGVKAPEPEPFLGPFPPQRFAAEVLADSRLKKPLGGSIDVVVTPHGLFLESPGQPFLYVPVGTPAEGSGPGELRLTLGKRQIELQFVKIGNPNRLARDVVLLLSGEAIIVTTDEYRRPGWLMVLAFGLAAAVVVAPVMFAHTASQSMTYGVIIGSGLALLTLLLNTYYLVRTRYSLESKVILMGGTAVALTAAFAIGAFVYVRTSPGSIVWRGAASGPEKPPELPFVELPPAPPAPPPPTYLDIAKEKGVARIEDATADVTALALLPGQTTVVAAYADGTSRLWALDHPTIEDWRPGPLVEWPVRWIRLGDGGKTAAFVGPRSTIVAPLQQPPKAPLRITGDTIAISLAKAKERDRIAVLRGKNIAVKLLPVGLPWTPTGTPLNGFTNLTTKQETPDASYRNDLAAPAKLTFLTFHPQGLLMGGLPDGSVITFPQKGAYKVENTTHKAPVRVLAHSASRPDFALGDEKGVVTFWPNSSMIPSRHAMLTAPVTALALDSKGQRIAAADASGKIVIHEVKPPAEVGQVQGSGAVAALAFGPNDETLIVARGKTIEIHTLANLVKRTPPPPATPPKPPSKPATPPKKK